VAILSQPDWHSCDAWRTFGARGCASPSVRHMDSMLTITRPTGRFATTTPIARRRNRPPAGSGHTAYCQRARERTRRPIIAGGVEASLRRLAITLLERQVRRSILLDAKPISWFSAWRAAVVEIVQRLAAGQSVRELRDIRAVAYRWERASNDECG